MRRCACRLILRLSIFAAAVACALALVADRLPMGDHDGRWGPARTALLLTGAVWLAGAFVLRIVEALDRRRLGSAAPLPGGISGDPASPLGSPSDDRSAGSPSRYDSHSGKGPASARSSGVGSGSSRARFGQGHRWGLAALVIVVELVYVWYVSVGQMREWPPTSNMYSTLAESFARGRLDLLVDPPPELIRLENPYDPIQRQGLSVLHDASYFRGRYYAYWGPAPAVLAALWTAAFQHPLGDQHIGFVAASFLFLFSTLIVLQLWRLYAASLPRWLLFVGQIVVGFGHPLLWNLSSPAVYETAILCGQAFLVGGLFFALPSIVGLGAHWPRLAIAGALWGLAVASRATLAPGVAALVAATTVGLFWSWPLRSIERPVAKLSALLVSLGLVLGALGTYNYLRFGNVAETGYRFQLVPDQDQTQLVRDGELFSLHYLLPNLFYYSFTTVRLAGVFPFLRPVRSALPAVNSVLEAMDVPKAYAVEDITGLAFSVPFVLFAALLAWQIACGQQRPGPIRDGERRPAAAPAVLGGALLLASALMFLPILTFRFVSSRYILDFSPLLVIASLIGAWETYRASLGRPFRQGLVTILIAGTALLTVVVSLLVALSGPASLFDDYNPELWRILTEIRLW